MASHASDTVAFVGLLESKTSPATTTKAALCPRTTSPIRLMAAIRSCRSRDRFSSSATRENGLPSCQSAEWMKVIMGSQSLWRGKRTNSSVSLRTGRKTGGPSAPR
jgi:hypothetical protein